MDDRNLREYALNIYKGISGYTLNKAFSLFPKYYPKIAFYYTEILTKQQNEMSLRMIQGLGIDKGRALLNEYNILNNKITKFFVDSFFKLKKSYRRIEAATDKNERESVLNEELQLEIDIMKQTTNILRESIALFDKIHATAQKYNFKSLEYDIDVAKEVNIMANENLIKLYHKYDKYMQRSIKEYKNGR